MKPVLWVGLAAAVGLSFYVDTTAPDEDMVDLPGKRSASSRAFQGPKAKAPDNPGRADDQTKLALIAVAFEAWEARAPTNAGWPALDGARRSAWAAQTLPPPPMVAQLPPPPPPPPMAPPFPHAWVGRYVDSSTRAVIEGAMQTWVVKANDVIEGQWRVDAIGERQLQLMYLPLQQSQTVNMKQ